MKTIILLTLFSLFTSQASTQGCVAIRSIAGISPDLLFQNAAPNHQWMMNISQRYFTASSTFSGDKFISDTLVTNRIYTLNMGIFRILKNGWTLSASTSIAANSRRNSRDHGGPQTPKYTTHAFGLGDTRLTVYKWLLDPVACKKGNIQAGVGIKLPTGDYKYQDYFHRSIDSTVLAPVDQSIQLGDGGTGITTELNAFYSFNRTIHAFISTFYLANPREQNGVSNLKGRNPTSQEIANHTTVMSVPDYYYVRGGANFQWQQIFLLAALRHEKVPVKDLIGGNKGFRRAASISSVETGVHFKVKNTMLYTNATIPFKRNIVQNAENNMTPAGFADCIFLMGVQCKL